TEQITPTATHSGTSAAVTVSTVHDPEPITPSETVSSDNKNDKTTIDRPTTIATSNTEGADEEETDGTAENNDGNSECTEGNNDTGEDPECTGDESPDDESDEDTCPSWWIFC